MVDQNVYAVRRLLYALNTGDVNGAVEFVSDEYQNDDFCAARPQGAELRGPEAFQAVVAWLRGAFPDLHFEEQEVISSGDIAVVRGLVTGTQQGEFLGIQPRGRRISSRQVHIFRLVAGRVSEHRTFSDDVAVMMQLGAISLVPSENLATWE